MLFRPVYRRIFWCLVTLLSLGIVSAYAQEPVDVDANPSPAEQQADEVVVVTETVPETISDEGLSDAEMSADEVRDALEKAPYEILRRVEKGEWTAFLSRRNA